MADPHPAHRFETRGDDTSTASIAENTSQANASEMRDRALRYRRAGRLAVLAATAATALAACGGGHTSPQVAHLGTSTRLGTSSGTTGGSSGTTPPKGNATELVDDWATCMRSRGDLEQADPTIDANNVIQVIIPTSAPKGVMDSSAAQTCGSYLTAAQTELRGGQPPEKPDPATLLKFSQCMRASGIPDFPDPLPDGGFSLHSVAAGGDLNPNNPTYQNAAKLCALKYGIQDFAAGGDPPPGSILETTSAGGNGGLGANS
jgi:hypothetical protein